VCVVTGHSYDGSTDRIQVELLRSGQIVAGYAPGFRVTAQTNVSGNTWDITVNLTDYTSATTIARWLAAADLVRITQGDSTTPTQIDGTVDSIQSATVVRVTFGSAWTPSTLEWALRTRDAGSYTASATLARYMFVAATSRRVGYSGSSPTARVFAA
jgi:hypothetical protein